MSEPDIELGRYFIYPHPEFMHSISYSTEHDPAIPAAIIQFSDGVGGYVSFPFDTPEDFDAFKCIMKEFIDAGERLFENYLEGQENE